MKFRNVLVFVLSACMVFVLCACGNADAGKQTTAATTTATEPSKVETTAPTEDNSKVTYTVKVVDEAGNGIAGAMVQLCLDACIPAVTDANGVATFNLSEASYKVSFVQMPAGYTSDVTEFYFNDCAYDMTITLKAAA